MDVREPPPAHPWSLSGPVETLGGSSLGEFEQCPSGGRDSLPPQVGGPAPEPVEDGLVESLAHHPHAVGHLARIWKENISSALGAVILQPTPLLLEAGKNMSLLVLLQITEDSLCCSKSTRINRAPRLGREAIRRRLHNKGSGNIDARTDADASTTIEATFTRLDFHHEQA